MKKKIQISLDDNIHAWFREQADLYGVSVSGLINIAMAEYRMQKETVGNMPQLMDLMNMAIKAETLKLGGKDNE